MRSRNRRDVCDFSELSWARKISAGRSALLPYPPRLLPRSLSCVISGAVVHLVWASSGRISKVYLHASEIGIGKTFRRIVSEQILCPQFVADFAEGFIELGR